MHTGIADKGLNSPLICSIDDAAIMSQIDYITEGPQSLWLSCIKQAPAFVRPNRCGAARCSAYGYTTICRPDLGKHKPY